MKTVQKANDFFNDWVKSIEQIQNAPLLKVAKTFENYLQGLLDYVKHRVKQCHGGMHQYVYSTSKM